MKEKKFKKVIVAHPAQQHSYKLASAIKGVDMLEAYCTTVYYRKDKLLYKFLGAVLGKNNIKKMKGRRLIFLEDRLKQFNEILGLFYIMLYRIDKKDIICTKIYNILVHKFGVNVAKLALKTNSDAVILYDSTAYSCFEKLKYKKVIKIIDMSSIPNPCIKDIIINDMGKSGSLGVIYNDKIKSYTDYINNRAIKEIELADYFLAPSNFVKGKLLSLGVKEEQIYLNPFGVDIEKFKPVIRQNKKNNDRIRFLFVGRLEPAKGIYYLLEAFKELNNKNIELVIAGKKMGNDELYSEYEEYFTYVGTKIASEMPDLYNSCDIFICPSLWEGLSLSSLEAMASALPVIVTESSGVNDLVCNGKEGFIIPAQNIEALKEKIVWFIENRDKINEMGINARKCAEKYSWDIYYSNVQKNIKDIMSRNN